jgi:mediator of RNA polymerase II transcription subunit 12
MTKQPPWAIPPQFALPISQSWGKTSGPDPQNNHTDAPVGISFPLAREAPPGSTLQLPLTAPDQSMVIDLTGPAPREPRHDPLNTPNLDGTLAIPSTAPAMGGLIAGFVKPYGGVPCSRPLVQNSRARKHVSFSPPVPPLAPPAASPQFIQPSKVYHRGKNALSPPAFGRKTSSRRQQIHSQSSKSDFGRSNSRRDSKPKPYHIDSPQQSQVFPRSSRSTSTSTLRYRR